MKQIRYLSALIIALLLLTIPVFAYTPYQNYTYNADKESTIEPQAYIPYGVINSEKLHLTMKEPQDLFIKGNKIFIADTGNNRILITDSEASSVKILETFQNNGKTDGFAKPSGLFVTESNRLYVADTDNERIIEFDEDLEFVRSVGRPKSNLLPESVAYRPKRISVDVAGRLFVVSEDMSSGMIELDHHGEFVSFFGAVKTKPKVWELLVRFFATAEQKERMSLIIPTEYSSNDIDDKGFVYGTVGIIDPDNFNDSMFIHRLNPIGDDILNRDGTVAPMGDAEFVVDDKTNQYLPSMLVDICVKDTGLYTVLDRRFGRIFTYDQDGNLLYVFGSLGSSLGQFKIPVAIDDFGDRYAVLDSELSQIVLFQPTEYGTLITKAVESAFNQDYDSACEYWLQTLKFTSKSELSYSGVGDARYNQGNYSEAMKYYKLGNNRKYYSAAFEQYRTLVLDNYFTAILISIAVLILLIAVLAAYRKKRRSVRKGE